MDRYDRYGIRLGSLFDGIGGFPLAAVMNGIRPVWASEIDPFPRAVTQIRFPEMRHAGDITKLHGENLPVVDIITGGSPCQDLSCASGRRLGLAGGRSGLFREQVRIVKEMRKQDGRRMDSGERRSDQPVRPRYMVWENVPGAFSSGIKRGEDFRIVLEEICRIPEAGVSIPGPPSGVWPPAGLIMGEGYSVAFRVLDAQFWNLPQRRKRIYLIADFDGYSAGEILFESESVWRHYQAVCSTWEETPTPVRGSTPDTGRDERGVICLMDQGGERMDVREELAGTLLACSDRHPPIIMATSQGNAEIGVGYCPTITAAAGMSGNNQPILFDNHGPDLRYRGPVEIAQTLTAALGIGGNNTPLAVMPEPYCIVGNIINRQDKNGGNGCGFQQRISYTLTATDQHYVMDTRTTERLVRRILPLECERLMGFPDGWTDIPGACDSKRYKALGNSIAVPCAEFILSGIVYFLTHCKTE